MNIVFPTERIELNVGESINFSQVVGDLPAERISGSLPADQNSYDNASSGLDATNVQDAIDELADKPSVDAYTKQESDEKYATKTELSAKADVSAIPTKTSDLQNDSGFAQIDDSEASASKTWSSEKIESLVNPTIAVKGSVASFITSLTSPLLSVKADITGTETGTGTRTPANPYTVTKFNAVELKHYADDIAEADTVTIALGDTYYRGKLTITDKGNGYASVHLDATHRAIVLDSSLLSSAGWYDGLKQLGFSNILTGKTARYVASTPTFTSDKLKPIGTDYRSQNVGNYITLIGSGNGVAVSIPECDTEAKARAFFNDNTIIFCYELATAISLDLPDISSIIAFSGENNIVTNCGAVEVSYKSSVTDVELKMQNELSELDESLTEYVEDKTTHTLEITTVKLKSSQSPSSSVKNLCFVCGKWINSNGKVPDYEGYLFMDEAEQKFYYTTDLSLEPQYLFTWDSSLTNGVGCKVYAPTITADGDIIFLRDHAKENPIVYPNGDYSNPYVVDFGANRKPYGWLMSSSVIQFADGSFCWGDYAYHTIEDEQNDDRRIIWRVTKPYNNPANWVQAHSFKFVYFTSSQSNEPDNEIGHIHALLYDFYADDLYCTTGDIDRHCRMWISTDHGETWSAVPGAVGTTEDTTRSAAGQKWRMCNAIFTKDTMWWCTDAARPYHKMWKCLRGLNGHIDFDTLTEVVDLEIPVLPNDYSQRTYITALVRNPDGLLLIDRGEPRPNELDVKFYNFESGKIEYVRRFYRATTDASELDDANRIGLPQQCTTIYQAQTLGGILMGGGTVIRPNNTGEFNNSKSNYVGTLMCVLK